MKVASVETFMAAANWRNFIFVKITTDEDVTGWGEATLGWKEAAVNETILDYGRRYVVGSNPFDIEGLWFTLYQTEHNVGPVMFSAIAGIEMALWDIIGKVCGQPVYNLIGGKARPKVRAYANGWYCSYGDLGRLAEQSQKVVSLGYEALKFDPFGPGGREITRNQLHEAVKQVEAVRKAVGDSVDILVEFHGRFSPIMALEAVRALVPLAPYWCEEPVPPDNHEAMAQVVNNSPVRVATGEHVYSRFGFLSLLERKAAHVVQPDLVYSGGLLECKKIAALAETWYVSVAPHNCDGPLKTAAAVHLCANIPNFLILETFEDFDVSWRCDIAPDFPRVEKGYYSLPSTAGWGLTVNEEILRAHPYSPDAKMNMFAEGWEKKMCTSASI